jgi:hypothetical protein
MKYLSVANVILRIKISRTSDGLVLSQSHYVEKVLNRFSKGDHSTVKIPIDIGVHMSKNRGKGINSLEYSWIIKSLVYVMNCIRLVIVYSICKLNDLQVIQVWIVIKQYKRYSNIWGTP